MPKFNGPGGMKKQSLVAVYNKEAFEKAGEKESVPVNVQVDMTTKTQKALREIAAGDNGAYAARASLAAREFTGKDGKKHTGYNTLYTKGQVQAMFDAAGPAAAESDKGAVYAPFQADVFSKGNGNYSVNTKTIEAPVSSKPFDIEKHQKNCKITAEAYAKAKAKALEAAAAAPEAEAEAEAGVDVEDSLPEA